MPLRRPKAPKELDVVAIGNALVDVLARAGDDLIATLGLRKGAMTLVGSEQVDHASSLLHPETRVSGGSAANTAVGIASLGASAGFIGRVDGDELGRVFKDDINEAGVVFRHRRADPVPPAEEEPTGTGEPAVAATGGTGVDSIGAGTGHCFVIVTPDAERTMATYLGVAGQLRDADVDEDLIRSARVTYLEGYLWDLPETKDALRHAAAVAHGAGRLVALSLSDPLVVERHRSELRALIEAKANEGGAGADPYVDVVFGNEEEVMLLYGSDSFEEGAGKIAASGVVAALTRGSKGSLVTRGTVAVTVEARKRAGVVDTTGAGDLYAAGFLAGLTRGQPGISGNDLIASADLERCGALGSLAAAEIISHMGSRPVISLAKLAAAEGLLPA